MVLLDLKLKGEGGKSICKYIKRSTDLKNIPVILVSGSPDIQKVAKEAGADDFIKKPFELDDFINKVRTFSHARCQLLHPHFQPVPTSATN